MRNIKAKDKTRNLIPRTRKESEQQNREKVDKMDGANGPGHSSMLRLEGIIVYGLGLGFYFASIQYTF